MESPCLMSLFQTEAKLESFHVAVATFSALFDSEPSSEITLNTMLVLYATAAAIFWRLEASGLCRQQLCTFAVASLLVAGKVLDLPCPDHAHLYKVYTKVVNAISHCSHLTSENISPNQFTQVLLEYELKLMERIDFVCNKNLSLSHAYTKLAIMSSGNELHAAHSVLVCMFLTPICRYIDDVGDLGTLSLSITSSLKALDLNVSIQNDFARVGGLMNTFWTTYEEVLRSVQALNGLELDLTVL